MSTQTRNGKAFEYCFAKTFADHLAANQDVILVDNSALRVAQDYFESFSIIEQEDFRRASTSTLRTFEHLEPMLFCTTCGPLSIRLQDDHRGQSGDVRDILFSRSNGWEIGISAKHNNDDVKHSRLSDTIDFGARWLGVPCSSRYFQEIQPFFAELRDLKRAGIRWSDIENKASRFYVPVLRAFLRELQRIDEEHQGLVPKALVSYLLGSNDFYKVMTFRRTRTTQVQAFLFYGTLNRSGRDNTPPRRRLTPTRFPTRLHSMEFAPDSDNTVLLVMDEGWQLSLRIHNASTLVEPSLKFAVKIEGQPSLYSHDDVWA